MKSSIVSRVIAIMMIGALCVGMTPMMAAAKAKPKPKIKPKPKTALKVPIKPALPVLKIGFIGPVSLGVEGSTQGNSMKRGFILAMEESKVKLAGYNVQYVIADDQGSETEALKQAKKLIATDKVQALVGSWGWKSTDNVSKVANAEGIPMVAPISTWDSLTGDGNRRNAYTFRACAMDELIAKLAASYALKQMNARTAAVFLDDTEELSRGLADQFIDTFTEGGGTLDAAYSYNDQMTDREIEMMINKMVGKRVDVIFLSDEWEVSARLAKAAKDQKILSPILGTDRWDGCYIYDEAMEGACFINQCAIDDPSPAMSEFVKRYKNRWGIAPDTNAALSYDAANMIIHSVIRAKSAAPESIKNALQGIKGFAGVTGSISVDRFGDAEKSGAVVQIERGEAVYVGKAEIPEAAPQASASAASPNTSEAIVVNGIRLTTAGSSEAGYSLLVPENWVPFKGNESEIPVICVTAPNEENASLQSGLNPRLYKMFANGVEAGYTVLEKQLSLQLDNFETQKISKINVSGSPGIVTLYTYSAGGRDWIAIECFIVKNGQVYNMVYKSDDEKVFNKYLKAIAACFDSVQLFTPYDSEDE